MGLLVGAAGLVIGTRGGEPQVVSPPVVIVPPPAPEPAVAVTPPPSRTISKLEIRLDADAPGARVTFRRRVTDAPATFQINPSDIVELVEIAAPGYKTERYWLTFDRPTHLTARMAKGDGLAEATEEETLVALGELAAPAAADAVAADPVAADPVAAVAAGSAAPVDAAAATAVAVAPVRKPVIRPVRRKIGRAVAPKPAVVAIEPDPVVAAPAALDGDPAPQAGSPEGAGAAGAEAIPSFAPDSAHSSDPLKQDLAKPDPAKPDPAKVDAAKADAARADPAKADVAKVEPAKPDSPVAGDPVPVTEPGKPIDAAKPVEPAKPAENPVVAAAKARVAAHRLDIQRCFAAGRVANKALAGTIRLELQIGLDGRVKSVQPHASFDGPPVVSCSVKAAINWAFPDHATGDVVTVIFTIP